ncbi:MAG: translation initiation factor IF-2 [Candidatus Moranbacteria bacterium]|nr:translation initiation factor IF-2 [Candidatus Moranbacteria bacterium]
MAQSDKIKLPSIITVKEFAKLIDKPVSEVIKVLMENGFLANINETLDFETASLIAGEFGLETQEEKIDEKKVDLITPDQLAEILKEEKQKDENLEKRPPIVTILGHVDHGKTSLLDTIRKTETAAQEAGGITQHITAYQVKFKEKTITFVDTPGHEAFKQMRARGAGIADIAILIVAADDGVKPQTKEVIDNLKDSQLPIVVAINKIDKPQAKVEMVKSQLAEAGVMLEKRGGQVPAVEISAKNNINIEELLETILLLADVNEIKADYNRKALGIILESHLDPRKGPVATAIIKTGVLNQGDQILAQDVTGTARQILDYKGKRILSALPGSPVVIIGLNEVCKAGSVLQIEESRSLAKKKAKRIKLDYVSEVAKQQASVKKLNQEENEELKKINIIIKVDVEGSLEAIKQIIDSIDQTEILVNVLVAKVGSITETDVQLAMTSNAIIYGFKTSIPDPIMQTAQKNQVKVKIFDIIYKLIEDLKEEMTERLEPEIVRNELGRLKVLEIFRTEKTKMIVGGRVTEGKVINKAQFDIIRNKEKIASGVVEELRHNQDQVNEVKAGMECGITYVAKNKFSKIEKGDVLEFFQLEEVKKKIK